MIIWNLEFICLFSICIFAYFVRIAILGGSFDPPHLGHLLVAQQTLDFAKIDEVWLMPCFFHPFDKKITSGQKRLEMCQSAIEEFNNRKIRVSDFEIRLKKKSYTIETILILKKTFKSDHFFWLIGSDNLSSFKKWKDWQKLLTETKFLVFPRIDYPLTKIPQGFTLIKSKRLISSNLSSEAVRMRVKNGLSIKGLVTTVVEEYISRNRLYK